MKDDSAETLPQKPLPRFSIRWLIGLITVVALFFTVCQLAFSGVHWAQVIVLLVGIGIATFFAYAAFFLIGMVLDSAFVRRSLVINPDDKNTPAKNQNSKTGTTPIVAWLAATIFFASASNVSADVTWLGTYPTGPNTLDYRLQVGAENQFGPGGYVNLHLQFKPTGRTFATDHDLTVTVSGHDNYKSNLAATTSQSFRLNQSSASAMHQMLIPHFAATKLLRVWVTEDGKEVARNRLRVNFATRPQIYSGQRWTIGIVDPETDFKTNPGNPNPGNQGSPFPDVRSMTTIFGENGAAAAPIPEDADRLPLSARELRRLAEQPQPAFVQYRVFQKPDLPMQWLAYSDLDLIIIDGATWSDLNQNNTLVVDPIQKFVAAGGLLLLYGKDSDLEVAKKSFGSPNQAKNSARFKALPKNSVPKSQDVIKQLRLSGVNDTSLITARTWNGEFIKESEQTGNSTFRGRQNVYDDLVKADSEMTKTLPNNELAAKIETASLGLGKVAVIHDEDPFPGSFQLWMTLESALLETSTSSPWIERHGLDYNVGNTNYWRWLIESVGGPPVKSFLTLNTLFVLTVGPIAYFLLRRFDRLYLLYFGAPAMAVLFTGGLFGFAVFSDGIGTKLRSHQWTWVDAASGVVVHQDRSTIFSSFGTDSLRFDRQALVLPVLPTGVLDYSRYQNDAPANGRVLWRDDAQIWSGEFLPTRSQVQYQVTRPFTGTASPVEFDVNPDDGRTIVFNRSELAISPLIYRDSKSAYHFVASVGSGASATMQPSSQQAVQDLIGDKELPPPGFVPNVRSSWSSFYNPRYPTEDRPKPEWLLSQWMRTLPKNCFVGLSEVDPSRFPSENPQVSTATHIVMGREKGREMGRAE
ncbi:hypothetical protein LF1_21970 [Rubripirellula obstinata]|uniref:Uncharacterized protein n=1 Tax=Rubripirellula obstinata TaxID=406547 RepID=A0A5B1CHJ2_9BACT|nr:hypothetical protein [Rubripirellula obstinata]KAA1259662.1 hypothetical protein LF1_21970 [Rubripirellula obstinata]